jgi:hypothetical protein
MNMNWTSIDTSVEPAPLKVAKLSDKAIEAKLVIRRTTLVKRDNAMTNQLRQNDASATAFTKLFRKEGTPIWKLMKAVSEVYAYHCDNTERCGDKRLVRGDNIMEYTSGLRHVIAVVDAYKAQAMPIYDQLVQDDIAYRNYGKAQGHAGLGDYPSATDFAARISFDFRMIPLPNEEHPLFDMNEDDKAAVQQQFHEMLSDTNNATVARMLEPLKYLTDRLESYKGQKGERFHTSVLENVLDGCAKARKLAIDASPELLAEIAELERIVKGYVFNVDGIKSDEDVRAAAKLRLQMASKRLDAYCA